MEGEVMSAIEADLTTDSGAVRQRGYEAAGEAEDATREGRGLGKPPCIPS